MDLSLPTTILRGGTPPAVLRGGEERSKRQEPQTLQREEGEDEQVVSLRDNIVVKLYIST